MEHRYGDIERERNLNQGKRPNQYESAAKIWFWFNIILFIVVILLVAFGVKDY